MTLADLHALAKRTLGPKASVRLTLAETPSGQTWIASAWRSTTTGSGAEETATACASTERAALDDLAAQLGATLRDRGAWVDPRQRALFGGGS
jgi:hypothetical protein